MFDFGAVVRTDADTVVNIPQPCKLVAETPVFAFDFGMAVGMAGRIHIYRAARGLRRLTACQRTDGTGSVPVGVFAQLGGRVLGNQARADGMFVVEFIGNHRLDGDTGQAEAVEVMAQYRLPAVIGG